MKRDKKQSGRGGGITKTMVNIATQIIHARNTLPRDKQTVHPSTIRIQPHTCPNPGCVFFRQPFFSTLNPIQTFKLSQESMVHSVAHRDPSSRLRATRW